MLHQPSTAARILRGLRRAGAHVVRTAGPGLLKGAATGVLILGGISIANEVAQSLAQSHPGSNGIVLGLFVGGIVVAAMALLSWTLDAREITRAGVIQVWGQWFFLGMYFCSRSALSEVPPDAARELSFPVALCPLFLGVLWKYFGPEGSKQTSPAT